MTKSGLFRISAIGAFLLWAWSAPIGTQPGATFATQVASLSEPGGYFDTDNLISNELSYLEVIPDLRKRGVQGGAYVGVGPDTNFTYIAAIKPDIAFIVDIRRDNLLLHLLFKSIFGAARTRTSTSRSCSAAPSQPTWMAGGRRRSSASSRTSKVRRSTRRRSPRCARASTKPSSRPACG